MAKQKKVLKCDYCDHKLMKILGDFEGTINIIIPCPDCGKENTFSNDGWVFVDD